MFGIVSTVSVLEKVVKENPIWRKIIESSRGIYVYKDKTIEQEEVVLLSQSGKLSVDESIKDFPSATLFEKYPECAFIMDGLDQSTATLIQSRYGVICQPVNDLDSGILTHIDPDHFELLNHDRGYGWKRICEGLTTPRIPSNCLIINDRNIFANDYPSQDKTPGLDNLEKILDSLLPLSFSEGLTGDSVVPYQVLVNCELSTLHDEYNTFATRINKIKRQLHRPYPIVIEFIALKRDNDFFDETHNRRIYSNYYTISCDHKLAAFSGNKSRCSQSLDVLKLFSKIEKVKSDQPVKGHDSFINKMRESVKYWMDFSRIDSYRFSQNGDSRPMIHNIQNRLIAPNKQDV